jgi:hypothetical protein
MTLKPSISKSLFAGILLCVLPSLAHGKPAVAVLNMGGDDDGAARDSIVEQLDKHYEILSHDQVNKAAKELDISISVGNNLARVATHLGAVAIIGGAIKGNKLTLAVYSGKTGQPIGSGTVPYRGSFARKDLTKAMAIVTKGLRKAPKKMGTPKKEPADDGNTMKFEPDGGGDAGQREDPDENPLAKPPPKQPTETMKQPEEGEVKKSRDTLDTLVELTLGGGMILRTLGYNDAASQVATYSSGGAFGLRVDFRLRPLAFFLDNFAGNFWLRLRYEQVLGLQSKNTENPDETFSTTLRQILFDFGYDWKILEDVYSPHLEIGMGYGLMDFSIAWSEEIVPTLPNAAYRFVFFSLGGRYPFYPLSNGAIGFHASADYRLILSAGDITNDETWFGPASMGGIGFTVGANANISKFLFKLEYSYARYFYAFNEDPVERATDPTKGAAAGALDQLHAAMLMAGYSF